MSICFKHGLNNENIYKILKFFEFQINEYFDNFMNKLRFQILVIFKLITILSSSFPEIFLSSQCLALLAERIIKVAVNSNVFIVIQSLRAQIAKVYLPSTQWTSAIHSITSCCFLHEILTYRTSSEFLLLYQSLECFFVLFILSILRFFLFPLLFQLPQFLRKLLAGYLPRMIQIALQAERVLTINALHLLNLDIISLLIFS